jgi:hypothetical protein
MYGVPEAPCGNEVHVMRLSFRIGKGYALSVFEAPASEPYLGRQHPRFSEPILKSEVPESISGKLKVETKLLIVHGTLELRFHFFAPHFKVFIGKLLDASFFGKDSVPFLAVLAAMFQDLFINPFLGLIKWKRPIPAEQQPFQIV